MVYAQAGWDYKKAKFDEAVAAADQKFAAVLNSADPNMKAFQSRGGKLILYHGWSDNSISPLNSINYYESIQATMGKQQADSFVRLYMVPGMQHCVGGPGPDDFGQLGIPPVNDPQHNIYQALEDWTEKGTPPSTVIAAKLEAETSAGSVQGASALATQAAKPKMTRPLCPHPQKAKYKGQGDPNQATSFTCENP